MSKRKPESDQGDAEQAEPETKTYEVVTPVEIDRRYEPGESIALSVAMAAPLLAVKAIKDLEPGKSEK